MDRALQKAAQEEAEEQRRQRGENIKRDANKGGDSNTTFDMFAADADLPPEVILPPIVLLFIISCKNPERSYPDRI